MLAQGHIRPELYPAVILEHLRPSWRGPRVRDVIAQLAAQVDVLALQEVDPALAQGLRDSGLAVAYAARGGKWPDGVALVSARHDLSVHERGSSEDGRRPWAAAHARGVRVVCAHVDWAPQQVPAHAGAVQLRQCLRDAAPDVSQPLVVAGDINGDWESPTGQVLHEAGLRPAHPIVNTTAVVHGQAATLDVLAVRGLRAKPVLGQDWQPYLSCGVLPAAVLPSDHVPVMAQLWRPEPR